MRVSRQRRCEGARSTGPRWRQEKDPGLSSALLGALPDSEVRSGKEAVKRQILDPALDLDLRRCALLRFADVVDAEELQSVVAAIPATDDRSLRMTGLMRLKSSKR